MTDEVGRRLEIRPLQERDLDDADRVMRVAFGTFLNAPRPEQTFGDADLVRTRYRADPGAAFCAVLDGRLVGSNFATRWGSFGFFGPLTVSPELWDGGVATRLMAPVMELFERWSVRNAGLFTFPASPKHVALYGKFGFWPQQLTPLMRTQIPVAAERVAFETFRAARREGAGAEALAQSREVTDSIYNGLDLEREILAVDDQGLGETVLLREGGRVRGFAVRHLDAGSEAGSEACYVKFAAVASDAGAAERFERLVAACESLAGERRATSLIAGVNTARRGAYRALLGRGYRATINGLAMLRPDDPAYNRPDAYVIDDLR
ncbi:MAG TPA: GNAT family N-acetyltransferase [Solirubrobacteraceae bacterium]